MSSWIACKEDLLQNSINKYNECYHSGTDRPGQKQFLSSVDQSRGAKLYKLANTCESTVHDNILNKLQNDFFNKVNNLAKTEGSYKEASKQEKELLFGQSRACTAKTFQSRPVYPSSPFSVFTNIMNVISYSKQNNEVQQNLQNKEERIETKQDPDTNADTCNTKNNLSINTEKQKIQHKEIIRHTPTQEAKRISYSSLIICRKCLFSSAELLKQSTTKNTHTRIFSLCTKEFSNEHSNIFNVKSRCTNYNDKEQHKGGSQHKDEEEKEEKPTSIDRTKISRQISYLTENNKIIFSGTTIKKDANPTIIIPVIPPPTIGVFAMYYILTKYCIISDFSSHSFFKQETESTQLEIERTYKDRIELIKKSLEHEKSYKQWGIMGKFFSWMASFVSTVVGAVLIFSGVGAILGGCILAAGLFTLANSIMEWTGSWEKIAKLLPGKAKNKKKALSWIKLGVSMICLFLSLISILFSGYTQVTNALKNTSQIIMGVFLSGIGISSIGESIVTHDFFHSLADTKALERHLAMLKNKKRDLLERSEFSLDALEQMFENLSYALEINAEMFRADSMLFH